MASWADIQRSLIHGDDRVKAFVADSTFIRLELLDEQGPVVVDLATWLEDDSPARFVAFAVIANHDELRMAGAVLPDSGVLRAMPRVPATAQIQNESIECFVAWTGPLQDVDVDGDGFGAFLEALTGIGRSAADVRLQLGIAPRSSTVESRGFLGLELTNVDSSDVVSVAALRRGGPAEQCGLEVGDRIVTLDPGRVMTAIEIVNGLDGHPAGDRLTTIVERDGLQLTVDLVWGDWHAYPAKPQMGGSEPNEWMPHVLDRFASSSQVLQGVFNIESGLASLGLAAAGCSVCSDDSSVLQCAACRRLTFPAGLGDGVYPVFCFDGDESWRGILVPFGDGQELVPDPSGVAQSLRDKPWVTLGTFESEGILYVSDGFSGPDDRNVVVDVRLASPKSVVVCWLADPGGGFGAVPYAVGVLPTSYPFGEVNVPVPEWLLAQWSDGSRMQRGNAISQSLIAAQISADCGLAQFFERANAAGGVHDELSSLFMRSVSWAVAALEHVSADFKAYLMSPPDDSSRELVAPVRNAMQRLEAILDEWEATTGTELKASVKCMLLSGRSQPSAALREAEVAVQEGDFSGVSDAGYYAAELGQLDLAERLQTIAIRQGQDNRVAATAINNLVFSVLIPQRRLAEARPLLLRSIALDVPYQSMNSLSNLGVVSYLEGNLDFASACFTEAMSREERTRAEGLYYLAKIAADRGDIRECNGLICALRERYPKDEYAGRPHPLGVQSVIDGAGDSPVDFPWSSASDSVDRIVTWSDLMWLFEQRGPVTHWWDGYGPARPATAAALGPDGTESWRINDVFMSSSFPGEPVGLDSPSGFRERVRATIESVGATMGQFVLPDGRSGLAAPWATARGANVMHAAEFRCDERGERCLWSAQVFASDDVNHSDRTRERIGLLLQQAAFLAEYRFRSGILRLVDLPRYLAFPNVPPELWPRPVVHAVHGDQEVVEGDAGGFALRERALIYRFGYVIDASLTDVQLADVLPVVADSVTMVLGMLESREGESGHLVEAWLGDPALTLALQSPARAIASPSLRTSPSPAPSPSSAGLSKIGAGGLGSSSVHKGLGNASSDEPRTPIDEDAPGLNPYALWPERSSELEARLGSTDQRVQEEAAREAAANGDGEAMILLAELAMVAGNAAEDLSWTERSANSGHPHGIARLAGRYFESQKPGWLSLFASAAICGHGLSQAALVQIAASARQDDQSFPAELGMLQDRRSLVSLISDRPEGVAWPAVLPLFRRQAELGWPGALGTVTWWALLEGHLQLGLDDGYELLPFVSKFEPEYGNPSYWANQLGNARSNILYLRLCLGEDASKLALEMPMWAGSLGDGLAPTEVFLIPQIARARSGDLAGARAGIAEWTDADLAEARRVAAEMAQGRGPIADIASEIQRLMP